MAYRCIKYGGECVGCGGCKFESFGGYEADEMLDEILELDTIARFALRRLGSKEEQDYETLSAKYYQSRARIKFLEQELMEMGYVM